MLLIEFDNYKYLVEGAYNRNQLISMLKKGPILVKFVKVSPQEKGKTRLMYCTLDFDLIPEEDWPKGTGGPYTRRQVRCYDLIKMKWRSFIVSKVKHVNNDVASISKVLDLVREDQHLEIINKFKEFLGENQEFGGELYGIGVPVEFKSFREYMHANL